MALEKDIIADNGITLSYHRIVSLNKIVNVNNIIEIASYVNEEQREREKQLLEKAQETGIAEDSNIYIQTEYIFKNYVADETIINAYDYLKTLDKYKDAVSN